MATVVTEVQYKADTKDLSKLDKELTKVGVSSTNAETSSNKTTASVNKMGKAAAATAKNIAVLGTAMAAAAAGGVAFAISRAFELADSIDRVATQSGFTVEAIQKVQFAAAGFGVEVETTNEILNEFSNRLGEATTERTGSAFEALERVAKDLGLSFDELAQGDIDKVFLNVVDAIGKIENASQRRYITEEILGTQAAEEFIRVVDGGAEGLRLAGVEAERLGLIMNSALIGQTQKASAEFEKLVLVLQRRLLVAVSNNSGQINEFLGNIVDNLPGIIEGFERFAYAIGLVDSLSAATELRMVQEEILALEALQDGGRKRGVSTGVKLVEARKKELALQKEIQAVDKQNAIDLKLRNKATNKPLEQVGGSEFVTESQAKSKAESEAEKAKREVEALQKAREDSANSIRTNVATSFELYRDKLAEIQSLEASNLLSVETANRARVEANQQLAQTAGGIDALLSPQEQYNNQLTDLNQLLSMGIISQDQYNDALVTQQGLLAAASGPLDQYLSEISNVSQQIEDVTVNAFRGMEDALVGFVQTGKLDFKSLADSMINDLIRIAARAAITSALSSIGGSLFGGIMHAGGVAGMGGMGRNVDPAMFVGAPKYHNGGVAGLKPNEVPAILERGETVLPKGSSGGGGGNTFVTNVNVDASNSKAPADEIARQTSTAVERSIRSIVNDEIMGQRRSGGMLNPTAIQG